jgi:hypothetical protein
LNFEGPDRIQRLVPGCLAGQIYPKGPEQVLKYYGSMLEIAFLLKAISSYVTTSTAKAKVVLML